MKRKRITLLVEKMDLQWRCGSWTEEYAAPRSGRGWQYPAATSSHKTRFDEELCERRGPDFASFRYLHEKFPQLSEAKIKERESLWDLRFDSSSKMAVWDVVAPWLRRWLSMESRGFDTRSSRHVGTLGKPFTCSCLCASAWNFDSVSVLLGVGSASE